jgi:two-component system, NtrC family, sensor histidine kinase PilS
LEARVRKEKLAAMGRMSAAVAHEIRNPLAAISQANALLVESGQSDLQRMLSRIVADNSRRLGRIVDDVLSVSRADAAEQFAAESQLELKGVLEGICKDWALQNPEQLGTDMDRLLVESLPAGLIRFDADHLRQVVFNLLDNAARHASSAPQAIRVMARLDTDRASIAVWSDGPPLDAAVEEHLFEPFFSSQSRSSGLGLYISRELCERHAAGIAYRRVTSVHVGNARAGNLFEVECQRVMGGDVKWVAPVQTVDAEQPAGVVA